MHTIRSLSVFALALVLLAYIPGRLLLRVARIAISPLDTLALSLGLGLVLSASIYWFLAYFSLQQYSIYWVIGTAGFFTYHWIRIWAWPRFCIRGSHLLLIGTLLLGVLMLAISPLYYSNLTLTEDGGMTVCPVIDVPLHAAIANELTHSIPPQNPIFSGWPLSYHVGSDVPTAMFANLARLSVTDLTVRFIPTLYFILTMLSVFCFSRLWLASDYGAASVTLLVAFGEDFSFVPGWLQRSPSDWSIQYFGVPTTHSLFCVNPMLPALGLLYLGLYCLLKSVCERQLTWQFIAGLLFAGLAGCKIFTAAHLGISMALASAIYFIRFRSRQMFQSTVIAAIFMAPVLIGTFLLNRGGAQIVVNFLQSHTLRDMVQALGLRKIDSLPQPFAIVVAVSIYLIGSFGWRVIGIPAAMKEMLSPRFANPVTYLLAIFVVVGVILSLAISIVPKGIAEGYNNAAWFGVESKYMAWIFTVRTVLFMRRFRALSRIQEAIFITFLVAASLPSTIQHFIAFNSANKSRELSSSAVNLIKYLRMASRPGEVVLSPEELIGPIVAMTKCHVPVGQYAQYMVRTEDYLKRTVDLQTFWAAWHGGHIRDDILRTYDVKYLITKTKDSSPAAIAGATMTFENPEWILYQTVDIPQPTDLGY
jgi:hypothetical protein